MKLKINFKLLRKETLTQTQTRVAKLCEDGNLSCGMDAQVALNELAKHLLGEDWYIVDPVFNAQANAIIVCEIERKYVKNV